jgi:hypothetical protein
VHPQRKTTGRLRGPSREAEAAARLEWGTHCKFPTSKILTYEDVQREQEDLELGWASEDEDELI